MPSEIPLDAAVNAAFAGQQGGAVVVRVRDGRVLAAHDRLVLMRRAATPGSAIKPFVLSLLLEQGAVHASETIACRRHLTIAGRRLDCSHPQEFAAFAAEDALAFSCNSYFAAAAARLRPGEVERRFRKLGFTRPSGLFPGEGEGHLDSAPSVAERQLLAVGVAGITVTPLELASAYLQLARLDPHTATTAQKTVLAGLRDATTYGLAQNAVPVGLSVAGKTGTASDAANGPTHAWFAGFAPAANPEIVVVVFVERGHGSLEAAAIARQIFTAYARRHP